MRDVCGQATATREDRSPSSASASLPPQRSLARRLPHRGKKWEDLFAAQLDAQGIRYVREYRFLPGRRFRFDFALEPLYRSIAVEVDGVVHRIKAQFQRDREKHNLALIAGWRVLHVSPDDVRSGKALF